MKLTIHTYNLQTRKVFTPSHGSAAYRRCMILELKHEGSSGYGEATEILYYGKNLEKMVQLVLDHKSWIESMDIIPPGARYKELLKMFDEHPWPIYKVKLGTDHDMDIMRAIRAHIDKSLRVDVNEGWTKEQTIEYSFILQELNVDYIEQPLPAMMDDEMSEVYDESALPLFADESCHTTEDIEKCADLFHFRLFNEGISACD